MWEMTLRNLYRDRRRTVATLIAVGTGLFAVLMFLGYIRFVEQSLASIVIHRDANAHVQVYVKDGPQQLAAFPARYSLSEEQQQMIRRTASQLPHFAAASSQLLGVGMISGGEESAVFLARGVEPAFEANLQRKSSLGINSATPEDGLLLTSQLQDLLGMPGQGDFLQLVGASYANRMNAIEAPLSGTFSTGIEAIEDKGLKVSLAMLQSLYDTQSASRLVIELDDRASAAGFRTALAAQLETEAPGVFEITTWDHPQIGQIYASFMGFFNMVFAFTGAVVFILATITIQHTVAMNIADRTRELGMLRAMGFSRSRIIGLFVRESLITTVVAASFALAFTYLINIGVHMAEVHTSIPRIAEPILLKLELPLLWGLAVLVLAVLCITAATALTARRRVGGTVRAVGKAVPLVRLLATTACVALMAWIPVERVEAAQEPDVNTMRQWLREADLARGGWGSYEWSLAIHTQDTAGTTETRYDVLVSDGRALARTTEPVRYQGEKILIASRAMWYAKPGLRRPVSISPQQRLVGEAANGDIAATQYARDYTPSYSGSEVIDGQDCHVLTLQAETPAATYESITYYLDKSSLMGVKADFRTASGVVFKTATFEYGNRVEIDGSQRPFVSTMTIVNANFPERFSRLEYEAPRPRKSSNSTFSIDNLMTM